jgi:hypothetical protein
MVMAMAMFFGMGGTGRLDFVRIKWTQLRFIGLQERTDYNSDNQDSEGDKGFLHAWTISISIYTRTCRE